MLGAIRINMISSETGNEALQIMLDKAREEGRQEGIRDGKSVRGYLMGQEHERSRILALIEEMGENKLCDGCTCDGWKEFREALKEKLK